ncbi:MAG: ABZJ_00895 family protein [Pikeienuella sp.]
MSPISLSIFFFFVYLVLIFLAGGAAYVIEVYGGYAFPKTALGIVVLSVASYLAAKRYVRLTETAPSPRTMWRLSIYLGIAAAFALLSLLPLVIQNTDQELLNQPGSGTMLIIVLTLIYVVQTLLIRVFFGMGVNQEIAKQKTTGSAP